MDEERLKLRKITRLQKLIIRSIYSPFKAHASPFPKVGFFQTLVATNPFAKLGSEREVLQGLSYFRNESLHISALKSPANQDSRHVSEG